MDLNLEPSELLTYAVTRAGTKWAHGQFVPIVTAVRTHPIRIEVLRLLPELRTALNKVRRDIDFRSCRHKKFAQIIIIDRLACHKPKRRIKPKSLIDDFPSVSVLRKGIHRGNCRPRQTIEFSAKRDSRLGMLGQQIPEPVE